MAPDAAVGTLVDSNVLLDILTEDSMWQDWSTDALADAAEAGPVFINPIIYSEVSIRFTTVEALEEALPQQDYRREPIPWPAAFWPARSFWITEGTRARRRRRCRTSSSALTQRSPAWIS